MPAYIVYNEATGDIVKGGSAPDSMIAMQAGEGEIAREVPDGFFTYPDPNIALLKSWLHARIDAEAGAFRLLFITDVPGQQLTYQKKEAEARGWTTGDDAATVPFLAAEATATGQSIDDIVTLVLAQADAWVALGAAIEGARMGAKHSVTQATAIHDIFAAATVDWPGLIP